MDVPHPKMEQLMFIHLPGENAKSQDGKAQQQKNRNDMTKELKVGDWIIFQPGKDGGASGGWVGNAVSKSKWEDQCMHKNNTGRRQTVPGSVFLEKDDYAINVQHYITKEIGSLEYIAEAAEHIPIV